MSSSRKSESRLLTVEDVWKSFGDLGVLEGIGFRINSSGFVTFLGPSGCGKTTLFKILLGLVEADRGTIRKNYSSSGYLPQEGLLFPWKTLMENVELPMKLRGIGKKERRARIRKSLKTFGLSGFEESYPKELSGGMRQRAALLRSVLTDAPVLFLDEPFGSLDALTRYKIQHWLLELLEEIDRSILFITHDIEEVAFLGRKIAVLSSAPANLKSYVKNNRMGSPDFRRSKEFYEIVRRTREELP